jgi:glycerol kinase
MTDPLLLALDAGTTGIRAIAFDTRGTPRASAYEEISVVCPRPGWVETDPRALWQAARRVIDLVARQVRSDTIAAIGIASQRGTTIVWDRATGEPVAPAIVWQDVRTSARVEELQALGKFASVMASSTKVEWILRQGRDILRRAERAELCFGTVDTWLAWNLTGGGAHLTDPSNASCTGLYDFASGGWDAAALDTFGVPGAMMPMIVPTCGMHARSSVTASGLAVPVAAIAGDQQASMFGQLRTERGDFKVTFGTSAMVDVHTGEMPVLSQRGAYPLVLWDLGAGRAFCLEGSAVTAGAAIQWLRDGLGVIGAAAETSDLAWQVPDNGGVWVVPAFQGLGTPYLKSGARALIGGLSRASNRAHLVRATLEGIAFRCGEIVESLAQDLGSPAPAVLRADGGAAENDFLLQHLANVLGASVERAATIQATALGAALLAGVGTGIWREVAEIRQFWRPGAVFEPKWDETRRREELARWRDGVAACLRLSRRA